MIGKKVLTLCSFVQYCRCSDIEKFDFDCNSYPQLKSKSCFFAINFDTEEDSFCIRKFYLIFSAFWYWKFRHCLIHNWRAKVFCISPFRQELWGWASSLEGNLRWRSDQKRVSFEKPKGEKNLTPSAKKKKKFKIKNYLCLFNVNLDLPALLIS